MKALTRMIRSLFGLSESSTDDEPGPDEGDVTVEREVVDAETEAAVKGTDDSADGAAETEEDIEAAAEPEIEEAEAEPEVDEAETEEVAEELETGEDEPEAAAEDEESEAESEGETTEEEETGLEEETTEEEETGPEGETAEEVEADVSVEEINGIGPTYSERLAGAGLGTIAALAESDPATVAEAAQAPESRAEEWIEQAAGWD